MSFLRSSIDSLKRKSAVPSDHSRSFLTNAEKLALQTQQQQSQTSLTASSASATVSVPPPPPPDSDDLNHKRPKVSDSSSSFSLSPPFSLSSSFSSLSLDQIFLRFRELGQPIRLFGENQSEALKRLEQCFGDETREINKIPQQHVNQGGESQEKKSSQVNDPPSDYLSLLPANYSSRELYLIDFFKCWLKCWEFKLQGNHHKEKREFYHEKVIYQDSLDSLKPFFSQLKRSAVAESVIEKCFIIAEKLRMKEFKRANEVYMELAIGNAPWPMGVTMVGIHERSGREKLAQASNVGHVLNNEKQRKIVQTIKRCVTFTEEYKRQEEPKS
jgi:pre-mRNA-splicing factor 18